MAEKNGSPLPLLSYVQGDAISGDVVLLEKRAVDPFKTLRSSHSTQQQAGTNSSPTREESAARNSRHRNHVLLPGHGDVRHVRSGVMGLARRLTACSRDARLCGPAKH